MIKPKWHPASEKPKYYGLYLTVVEVVKGKVNCMELLCYGKYIDGVLDKHQMGWYEHDREWECVGYGKDVLYWMELPEMPKE